MEDIMEDTMHILTEKLFRLEMLLHRHYHIRSHGRTENPHKGQGRVLMLLYKCGQLSQRELPYLLDMRKQSVRERLLKREKKGFNERTVSDEEKRGTMVTLTEEGRSAGAAAEAERAAAGADDIFSCLPEDERRTFEASLDRIIEALEARLPDLPSGQHPHHHGPDRKPHGGFPPPQVWNLSEPESHHGHHGHKGAVCKCHMDKEAHGRGAHPHGCPHGEGHPHPGKKPQKRNQSI